MTIASDEVRLALERIRGEIDAFDRRGTRLTRAQREQAVVLRIRRNLLVGLLMVRARERPKPIVDLALWRWGLAPRATMLRYGMARRGATTAGARGIVESGSPVVPLPRRRRDRDATALDGSDPFVPEAG